ncbi:MAG: SDR family oxidoreductase [Myxococcota bacterium]
MSPSDRSLRGKVAVVTGAGPGIGRATALALAADGASVVVAARRAARLGALADDVARATGARCLAVPTDIADAASRAALVERVAAELGRVDALVNVAAHGGPRARVAETDWDAYLEAVRVNVVATMSLCGLAAERMRAAGTGGSIVNIGALSSTTMLAKMASYTTTKAAMVVASKTMAREVGPAGIRVNVVTPGFTTGAPLDAMFAQMAARTGGDAAELSARAAREAALHRHVDPEDVAEAVLFLASERGRGVTGVELHVNAGLWIG